MTEHAEFLRSLALALVEDVHRAEDLVQDAQLLALAKAPMGAAHLRSWFARVMRNRSIDLHRARSSREYHERVSGQRTCAPAASDVEERLEVQQTLGALVQALEEPYRTPVYMRFFEDKPPREIAAALDVPVNTVKTRLQRGLEKLRRRLDESFDGQRSLWCGALAPLILGTSRAWRASLPWRTGALVGGLLLNAKLLLPAALLASAAGWMYFSGGATPAPLESLVYAAAEEVEPTLATVAPGDPVSSPAPEPARQAVPASAPAEPPESTAPATGLVIHGTVRLDDASPAVGAFVRVLHGNDFAGAVDVHTDEQGEYSAEFPLPTSLSPHADLNLTVRATLAGFRSGNERRGFALEETPPGSEVRVDFELGRSCILRGLVLDSAGLPAVREAVAVVRADCSVLSTARTDENGRFELAWNQGGEVFVAAGSARRGYVHTPALQVGQDEEQDLGRLRLREYASLRGRITLIDGSPAARARFWVRPVELDREGDDAPLERWIGPRGGEAPGTLDIQGFGGGDGQTDAEGEFELSGLAPGTYKVSVFSLASQRSIPSGGPFHTGDYVEMCADGYVLVVRIVDRNGLAVGGVKVAVTSESAGCGGVEGNTHGDRPFAIGVCPGTWLISASKRGAMPVEQEVEVLAGVPSTEVEVPLRFEFYSGSVAIAIVDERGEAIPDYRLDVFPRESLISVVDGARPDEHGVVEDIPVGDYEFRVIPGGEWFGAYFEERIVASVRAGERTELSLTARTGGWIEFDLGSPEGASGTPVMLTLQRVYDGETSTVSRLLQRVQFPGGGGFASSDEPRIGVGGRTGRLVPGFYAVHLEAEGFLPVDVDVEVVPGETTEKSVEWVSR